MLKRKKRSQSSLIGGMATRKLGGAMLMIPGGVLLALTVMHSPAAADFALFAVLNSGQEIQDPKPNSNALGTAVMTFTESTDMLCYSISYTALVGAETVAHFHAPASAGENASVLFPITPEVSPLGSPKVGCVGPLTGNQKKDLIRGLFYINIHSSVATSGEIRGQVYRVQAKQAKDQTVADTVD
jgi:CHRD domain